MSRSVEDRLEDVLKCCKKILQYTSGIDQKSFLGNDLVYDAVLRNLMVMGEAAKAVPEDTRVLLHEVPWREIAGLRDILIHVYFRINPNLLWTIIIRDIPLVHDRIERHLFGPSLFS